MFLFMSRPPLLGEALLPKVSREANPIRAAERRQILATGASPWFWATMKISPVGATDFLRKNNTYPRAYACG
jgi:hypothetical protein